MHPDFPQLPIPTGNKATLNSARISTAEDVLKIEQAKTTWLFVFRLPTLEVLGTPSLLDNLVAPAVKCSSACLNVSSTNLKINFETDFVSSLGLCIRGAERTLVARLI